MSIRIKPYTEDNVDSVKALNQRLKNKGIIFKFPEAHLSADLPHLNERSIFQDYFLALENDKIVRGGYILKHQDFIINNETFSIGNYQLPLSEGTIDNKYNMLGIQLLTDALKKQNLLYALGMGGFDKQLPQLLSAMGWRLQKVPFYFKICNSQKFLKGIPFLHRKSVLSLLCKIAAVTKIGSAGINLWQWSLKKRHTIPADYKIETISSFDERVDKLCSECTDKYSMFAKRTKEVLNILYPPESNRFHRILIIDKNINLAGWAVLLDTKMKDHKYFGNLEVGTIADCLAKPTHAKIVMAAAAKFLEQREVDIIVSNQSHPMWCSALSDSGFLEGPSNFILGLSKKLTSIISEGDPEFMKLHFNRGDGDGPIHL